jgi:integrase
MARQQKALTVLKIRALKEPGRYSDGGGLYLYVSKAGSRSWVFRYRDRATMKHRDKGLGPLADVTLEQARDKAARCRTSLLEGTDPIDATKVAAQARAVAKAKQVTFGTCADRYIAAHKAGWRNLKHAGQWRSTLDTYCAALLPLPVGAVDTPAVLEALQPIWATKTETATRVRQRIEAVLDYATAREYRKGDNPARWRGHLQKLLPAPTKLKDVKHHAALPYTEAAEFMAELRKVDGLAAKALTLQILTATRPNEAIAARWSEFDKDKRIWTIPKDRMKAGQDHRVPVGDALQRLLDAIPRTASPFVFPGKPKRPMTTAALLKTVQELRPGLTAHGFRSTFRDWAADQTAYPREVAEAALAHALKDKTEAAYRRTDLFEKRARMMDAWARFLATPKAAGKVVPMQSKKSGSGR